MCSAVAISAISLGMALVGDPGVVGAATRSGQVVVVSAENALQPMASGEHSSAFSLRLPQGAACPGDSRNDDWRVQTFFVPSTDDPGALTYYITGPAGPEDDKRVSLYTTDGRPFVDELLGANTKPGLPGEIPAFPAFSFGRLPVAYLPSGSYLLGVACTDGAGRTQTYWDTRVEVRTSPGAMSWSVAAEQPVSFEGGAKRWWVSVLVVVGAALLALAVVLWRGAGKDRDRSEGAGGAQ